jgi:hypothetical protein
METNIGTKDRPDPREGEWRTGEWEGGTEASAVPTHNTPPIPSPLPLPVQIS